MEGLDEPGIVHENRSNGMFSKWAWSFMVKFPNKGSKGKNQKRFYLDFGSTGSRYSLGDLAHVDSAHQVHLPRVNFQNICTSLLIRGRELDFSVNATGTQERRVQDVDSVRSHNHFDVFRGLEAVQLIQQLQHGTLDLGVAAT